MKSLTSLRTLGLFALALVLASNSVRAADPSPVATGVRIDRLEALANHLETKVDGRQFDMTRWGNMTDSSSSAFVGCAAGHATRIFHDEGFRLSAAEPNTYGTVPVTYQGLNSLSACSLFFGINQETAASLFGSTPRTPHQESERIRSVIASEKREVAKREMRATVSLLVASL